MNLNPSRLIAVAALSLASLASAVPVITEVVASPAPTAGGSTVVIRGLSLGLVNLVTIGGASAPITSANANTIFCVAPAGQGTNVQVQAFEPGNPSNVLNTFAYDIPRITNLSINTSPTSGGGTLTITGSNFGTSRTVTIGGTSAAPTGASNHTQIQCIIPAGQGLNQPITINVSGQVNIPSGTSTITYTAPTLTSLTPSGFTTAGGTATLNGSNLGINPLVFVNGVQTTIQPGNTHSSLIFNVPVGNGASNLVIVSVGGQISNPLTLSYPAPIISTILPSSGPTAGGYEATITGTNLGPTSSASITFNNQIVPVLQSSTGHTSLKFIVPPGEGINRSMTVSTGGQTSPTFAGFSYQAPLISQVVPAKFDVSGGTTATILGSSFGLSPVVTIAGQVAPILNQTHNAITCTVPAHLPGNAQVAVTVAGMPSNSVAADYICPADFNLDGSVDFFDYLDFVAAFSTPC